VLSNDYSVGIVCPYASCGIIFVGVDPCGAGILADAPSG